MGLAARLQGQGLALLCPGMLEARALRSSGAVRARGVRSEVSVAGDIGALRKAEECLKAYLWKAYQGIVSLAITILYHSAKPRASNH